VTRSPVVGRMRKTVRVPSRVELEVLGGIALRRDGEACRLGGPKSERALAVLVAQRPNAVSMDRLIESIWASKPPRSATSTIQTQISRLRSLLAPDFTITFDTSGYRLGSSGGLVDADRFEELLTGSCELDAAAAIAPLESALLLWHGHAYGSFADAPEVRSEAARLEELRLVALDVWAAARIEQGDPAVMIAELEVLVDLHPLRESFWRLLMITLYRTGRQAEALRRAEQFRTILGVELGLGLSPALRELQTRILADDPRLLASSAPPTAHRHSGVSVHVLLGATSFIGRELELAALSLALVDQTLVTVTGPGGVGKTRLAFRAAALALEAGDRAVSVVEFASLRHPSGVAQVIAHALDIQEHHFRSIEATIEEHLAGGSSLLVLDNCEHVTATLAPLVDRLRSACPELRILATSREPLGLPGEYIKVLAPLDAPGPEPEHPTDIGAFKAVELFVGRAEVGAPGFALTNDNALAVADICRRLDGLPLGLELAAARLRTMDIHALARQLHQRTDVLGQTQRGADGRQRTLHHLVEWSYDLLDPDEQVVFEQLSLFAGGFDLSAAESVVRLAPGHISPAAHLVALVDKSMVLLDDASLPRYRLLEPLREFALDRLRHRQIFEATESRHLLWYRDLAERGAAGLDGPDEAAWSDSLDREFDNLRSAHRTALRRADADSALRLVASLREFAFRRIRYELIRWADASTVMPGASGHADLATVIAVAAYGRFVQGDMETAATLALDALNTISVENGEPLSTSGLPERVLGNALFYMQRSDQALRWIDRMLQSARQSGVAGRITHALYMRSVAQTSIGDAIKGAVLAGEASAAARQANSPTAQAQAEYALGLALENTDPSEAFAHFARASTLAHGARNRWIEAFALTEVHWLQARRGDHLTALVGYGLVVDTWYRGGDWANQWLSLRRVLALLLDLGAHRAAAVLHGALTEMGAAHALPFEPADAERLGEEIAQLRTLLGPDEFADSVRQGAALRNSQIVSFVKDQIATLVAHQSPEAL
jgi:predicted ATPase/DNA-binding SARP family transcriptional activator